MASLSAAAIVVSHARKDLLLETLSSLARQTVKPTEVVVVETSNDASTVELAKQFGFQTIATENVSLNFAINSGIAALTNKVAWIWILHDDSTPSLDALEQLLIAAETSESVAVVGPKLLMAEQPGVIQQLGLTATKTGRPFVLVQEEYDQGQHDNVRDVLATSTAGMLVSNGVWEKLGGLNELAPTLAQDLDFGARCRAAGYRVIVEPKSRVLHHGLSITGKRSKKWTNGNWATALAKSESYIATILLPFALAMIRLLFLPFLAILQMPVHLYRRKPQRIWADFAAWAWSWAKFPQLLASRRRFRQIGNTATVRTLYASADQIRLRKESKLEHADAQSTHAKSGLISSSAVWFALIPLILNFGFFPAGPAISSPRNLFSSNSLSAWLNQLGALRVFDFEGKSYIVDSTIWWHGFFAIAAPESPSLALATFVFLAPAISYLGIWKLLSIFSKSNALNTWLALTVALALSGLVLPMSNFSAIALLAATPWTLWAILRMQLADVPARANRWLGLSALLLTTVAIISPVFALVILLWSIGFSKSLTSFLRVLLVSVPSILLTIPNFLELPFGTSWLIFSEEVNQPGVLNYLAFFGAATGLVIAHAFSFWGPRLIDSVRFTILSFLFLLLALVTPSEFAKLFLAATLIPMVVPVAVFLESLKPRLSFLVAVSLGLSLVIAPVVALLGTKVGFGSSQQVPALVAASSDLGQLPRMAKLEVADSGLTVRLVAGDGKDLSEYSLQKVVSSRPNVDLEEDLALAFARLSVGNSSGVLQLLDSHGVNFVLVERTASENLGELKANLDTVSDLQFAGETEFGWLYRVDAVPLPAAPSMQPSPWLPWQLLALGIAAAISLPTPASIRGTRRLRKGETAGERR